MYNTHICTPKRKTTKLSHGHMIALSKMHPIRHSLEEKRTYIKTLRWVTNGKMITEWDYSLAKVIEQQITRATEKTVNGMDKQPFSTSLCVLMHTLASYTRVTKEHPSRCHCQCIQLGQPSLLGSIVLTFLARSYAQDVKGHIHMYGRHLQR